MGYMGLHISCFLTVLFSFVACCCCFLNDFFLYFYPSGLSDSWKTEVPEDIQRRVDDMIKKELKDTDFQFV